MRINTKDLEVEDKITFIVGNKIIDGTILEKNYMSRGDIDFLIETPKGLLRSKHRNLNLYYLYKK